MLSTGNLLFGDWCAIVQQVLRRLMLKASVDIVTTKRAYTKPAPRRPTSASQHAVVESPRSNFLVPVTTRAAENVAVCQRHALFGAPTRTVLQ